MDDYRTPEAEECTLEPSGQFQFEHEILQPQLTILWHPQRRLVGARAAVLWNSAGEFEISRWIPLFRLADEPEFSLDDRRISRSPLLLKREPHSALSIHPPPSSMTLEVNGSPLKTALTLSNNSLQAGVTICLGRRVGLYLRLSPSRRAEESDHLGLLGGSYPMAQVRQQIRRIAATSASVLVRGETGTGKELVARALHRLSPRAGRDMVSVNMATLGGELAAAELFGARQGAYTGARGDRPGLIREANGSTLFLDEVGDAPHAVQVMLLRVLEEGRVRPLGDSRDHPVDVRYVAATDRPLEAGAERAFNQPLRRRLEAATINLPPLRERREDFGELFAAFLGEAEAELGHRIRVAADQVCVLAARPWSGNVRELRNFVTGLAINSDTDGEIRWNGELAAYLRPATGETASAATPPASRRVRYRDPTTVKDEELLQALNESGWRVMPAAKVLGVSRTSMYALIKQSRQVRAAEKIPIEEILEVMEQRADMDSWAARLKTPREALKRRINELEQESA